MIVNIEFLGDEPIENVITCLHFKIDRVIYFGYQETIDKLKESTKRFLFDECSVQSIDFHPLSHTKLQSVLKQMSSVIDQEKSQKNEIYFDITGGESLILVAFGMIAEKYKAPMHIFDIKKNELEELNPEYGKLKDHAPGIAYSLNLDQYVRLRGGIINDHYEDRAKVLNEPESMEDVTKIWDIMGRYYRIWNPFSMFLRNELSSGDRLDVSKNAQAVITKLQQAGFTDFHRKDLNRILDDLMEIGLLTDVQHTDGKYRLTYKNAEIQDLLWSGGKILELHMYQEEAKNSDDCRIGVHLDWDGTIDYPTGDDVLNEIDVLSLNGNVPTFISCKSGRMDAESSLFALYELETVAQRFGGKYARKILVTTRELGDVYAARAEEMGIAVHTPGKE